MDPEFLDNLDGLAKWIQHFDGTRGCHICIVDMPAVRTSDVALWRRLLLGEGDGFAPKAIKYSALLEEGLWGLRKEKVDRDSRFKDDELAAVNDDNSRPGVQLAYHLHRHGFPYISVVEGGFPALVEQLVLLRGTVEPLVVDHNPLTWSEFMQSSGRQVSTGARAGVSRKIIDDDEDKGVEMSMSYEEVLQIALATAARLGHRHMYRMIKSRLQGKPSYELLTCTTKEPWDDENQEGTDDDHPLSVPVNLYKATTV